MPDAISLRAFIPLPLDVGPALALLGPSAAEAGVAVQLSTPVEPPTSALQGVVGGVCDRDGKLVTPFELDIVVAPDAARRHEQIPTEAFVAAFSAAAARLPRPRLPGFATLAALLAGHAALPPLVFCRKARTLFFARSPESGAILRRPAEAEGADLLQLVDPERNGAVGYGPEGVAAGSLEDLLTAQPAVVQLSQRLLADDPLPAISAGAPGWCCQCEHCRQPDGEGGAYRASLDRLALVHAADVPLVIRPFGEWRAREALEVLGGRAAQEALAVEVAPARELEAWRRERAAAWEAAGRARTFAGESDGRELLEAMRGKLGFMLDALEQLAEAWNALERPHLIWNEQTLRAAWVTPARGAATATGLHALLRKVGWHPLSAVEAADHEPLPYPPVGDATLLPPEAADAARYWDEERSAQVFVKRNKGPDDVVVLIENLGIDWELFCPRDTVHVAGDGWQAVFAPLPERDPNDGEGLPFHGRVSGAAGKLKVGEEYPGCSVRWYPRFGEAVDLHAFGVGLLEGLLCTDERDSDRFRAGLLTERAEITRRALAVPLEQREPLVRSWVEDQAQSDAPAAVWTRRNGLWPRALRQGTTLEAFPATLWSLALGYALRLVTAVPGYSFCGDRTQAAPRAQGLLEPLVELRGLLALFDDLLYARRAPEEALRSELTRED